MEDYFEKGFLLIVADLLSVITISSCLVCKIPQIKTISAMQSAKGGCRRMDVFVTYLNPDAFRSYSPSRNQPNGPAA